MSESGAILSGMSPDNSSRRSYLAGIVTRQELVTEGVSRSHLATSVRSGSLVRLARGVYATAPYANRYKPMADGELLRVAAALAVTGSGVVASHQSAAKLLGIDLLGRAATQVTLSCPRSGSWKSRSGILLRAAELPEGHITTRLSLPVTTAARTTIDLARTSDFRTGVVAADSALHGKLTTKTELQQVVAACRGWPGITRAVEVVDFADMKAESPLESIARIVFRDVGLPAPELQVWLGGVDDPTGRVDFYWRKYLTVAEVDGAIKYADPAAARAQLRRDALLRADGYEVVHFDWQDITNNPQLVATRIRQAFRRGSATLAERAATRAVR